MLKVSKEVLISKLNPYARAALQRASELTVERSQYEVSVSHLLLALLEQPAGDVSKIVTNSGMSAERLAVLARKSLDHSKTGAVDLPEFSTLLLELFQDALTLVTSYLSEAEIRTGAIFAALAQNPDRYCHFYLFSEFENIDGKAILAGFEELTKGSMEGEVSDEHHASLAGAASAMEAESALAKFGRDMTKIALDGGIDPVFCRDGEIALMSDILSRRRKNNPILVGDPGVGKTALAEGLALKIAQGDVAPSLKGARLWELDLGALQAGASVKGEFERRLKAVLDEVQNAPDKIVLFIDEAHSLIGGGGQAGGSDAANLLKPALARGTLRAIAATTWSEYKKYFEKDAALSRRFQVIKLDEPSVEDAVTILRGLRSSYEQLHNVYISDAALRAASSLTDRYLTGRFLPDKALDVLDTASVRVAASQSTKPRVIDTLERKILMLEQERSDLSRDKAMRANPEEGRLDQIEQNLQRARSELERLLGEWRVQQEQVNEIVRLRRDIESAEEAAQTPLQERLEDVLGALQDLRKNEAALVDFEVGPGIISSIISDWTGVPAAAMSDDDALRIQTLGPQIKSVVCGQDHAIDVIHDRLKAARLDLIKETTPRGAFLLVGTSGVGKTETAEQIAIHLFGSKQFLTVINMSEYQEKHTVSRLIGSPPGYVGYGEGGVLTEAIRRAPYSVVLMDEVEKAHPDVLNVFYQAFDKGVINDGEGREIDCKNAIFFLTSNLGSEALMENRETVAGASNDVLEAAIRPHLQGFFKPALLARMQILVYKPLDQATLEMIIDLKLSAVKERLGKTRKVTLSWDNAAKKQIVNLCAHADNGARMVDQVIDKWILPHIAEEALERMVSRTPFDAVDVSAQDGGFMIEFLPAIESEDAAPEPEETPDEEAVS